MVTAVISGPPSNPPASPPPPPPSEAAIATFNQGLAQNVAQAVTQGLAQAPNQGSTSSAPSSSDAYQSQLATEFGSIYGANAPVNLNTIASGSSQNWDQLNTWIGNQSSGFQSWYKNAGYDFTPFSSNDMYEAQLETQFTQIYGANTPITIGTVETGGLPKWQQLDTWIGNQDSNFQSWLNQSNSGFSSTISNTKLVTDSLTDNVMADVNSAAQGVAAGYATLTGLMNGIPSPSSSDPGSFINGANSNFGTIQNDFAAMLGTGSGGSNSTDYVGALQRLQQNIANAENAGYTPDMVAAQVLAGLGDQQDAVNVKPGTGMTTAANDLANLNNKASTQLAGIVNSYSSELPGVVSKYETNQMLTGLTAALDIASAFVGFGTGLGKLALAGGLDKVASGDGKATAEFTALINTTLGIAKNGVSDGKALAALQPGADNNAPATGADQVYSAVQNWIQTIATNWRQGVTGMGGQQIDTLPSNFNAGGDHYSNLGSQGYMISGNNPPPVVSAGYAPGQTSGTQYSMFYWLPDNLQSPRGGPPLPTLWTLYGIPASS